MSRPPAQAVRTGAGPAPSRQLDVPVAAMRDADAQLRQEYRQRYGRKPHWNYKPSTLARMLRMEAV